MRLEEAEQDLQLALYALASRQTPELAELGEVAELVYLYPRHISYGRLARRTQAATPDLADRTRGRVRELAGEIAAERFDFSPTADCKFCEFKKLCPRHFGKDVPL
jgi:hypothetical protein